MGKLTCIGEIHRFDRPDKIQYHKLFRTILERLSGIKTLVAMTLVSIVTSCSHYNPLNQLDHFPNTSNLQKVQGITITYLGNTTILISDGITNLLVDGFLSRPGLINTYFGRIAPNRAVIRNELALAEITELDAILVTHTHHDHALDAAYISSEMNSKVFGSESYSFIYRGSSKSTDPSLFVEVKRGGLKKQIGEFTVTFYPTQHVGSTLSVQRKIEGNITKRLVTPSHFTKYKAGDVFGLYIEHPQGNIVVATTAGAIEGQLDGANADIVFLGLGLLSKESKEKQELYWNESVLVVNPHTIVPVHWDNFTRKLSKGLKPPPVWIDDIESSIEYIEHQSQKNNIDVRIMGLRDSFKLKNGNLLVPY